MWLVGTGKDMGWKLFASIEGLWQVFDIRFGNVYVEFGEDLG